MTRADRYLNRELSWLEFNQRVLDEALNPALPLLERLKFLAITSSNLNEFFMVRVGGLQELAAAAKPKRDASGMTPAEQLRAIAERTRRMVADQQDCYNRLLEPALHAAGLRRLRPTDLDDSQRLAVERHFEEFIYPILTPRAIRPDQDFPLVRNLSLYLAVRIAPEGGRRDQRYAFIPIELGLDRFVPVPSETGSSFMLLEDVVRLHLDRLFPDQPVRECVPFRVTRNADLRVREDLAPDLLTGMEEVLAARRTSACVRLELEAGATATLRRWLLSRLEAPPDCLYAIDGPLDLAAFMSRCSVSGLDDLRCKPWPPQPCPAIRPGVSMCETLARRDILLNHPYESFDPVVRLIEEAAEDPQVLAIKQILYRTSRQSRIVSALVRAAERGKYVTVIVELKARFDEARNIDRARELEEAGAQVIYGIKGLKTHAKVCLILRREEDGIRRYLHFGTGNYIVSTAALYRDIRYLSRNPQLGAEASRFFNTITGFSQPSHFHCLEAAPLGLRDKLLELIDGEIARKCQDQPAGIRAKMNSLVDPVLIEALYRASQAQVPIQLNVRGICCLRPGVPDLSENITVTSIVDRFLEHSRILEFHHGGEPRMFISSADWMPRNLDRRIELLVPVEDQESREKLRRILDSSFRDNLKARVLGPDGAYGPVQPGPGQRPYRSQEALHGQAVKAARKPPRRPQTIFEPHRPSTAES